MIMSRPTLPPVGVKRPNVTSSGKVQKMFSRLMDWKLSLWNDISHKEAARRPVIDIPVNRDTSILEKGKTSNTEFYHLPSARPLNSKTILIEKLGIKNVECILKQVCSHLLH